MAEKYPIYGYDLAQQAMKLIPKKIRPDLKIIDWKKNNSERLSDKELVKLYNESLVTLSLSKLDTFGLVSLESMAYEVPVVAFNVAGYRETILDGKIGFFLVDFEPKEIADKIVFLLKNPKIAQEMGKTGRNWIEEKWAWKIQIENLEKLLVAFSRKK